MSFSLKIIGISLKKFYAEAILPYLRKRKSNG